MSQFDPENLTRQPEILKGNVFPNENNIQNLVGFIQILPEDPSSSGLIPQPRNFWEQVVLVKAGGSTSAYFYDTVNTAWKYVKLT